MSELLNDDELRAWAQQVKRALFDASITNVEDAAVIDHDIYVRKPQHASGFHRVHGDYILISAPCASWTRGQRFTIELYRNGQVQWKGPDASVREMYLHLCKVHPRWRVPPQGDVPMCVVLRERNGWEGESWRYRDMFGNLTLGVGRMRVAAIGEYAEHHPECADFRVFAIVPERELWLITGGYHVDSRIRAIVVDAVKAGSTVATVEAL